MRRPKRVYSPRDDYAISKANAQRLGTAIDALERRLNRPVSPADLVEDGANPGSPFHDLFNWNDATAAHEYRLSQARYVMRAINVLLPEYGDAVVRGFIPTSYGPSDDGFMSTARALKDQPDVVRLQLKRLHADAERVAEDYTGWMQLIEFAPAKEYIQAAKKLAAKPV